MDLLTENIKAEDAVILLNNNFAELEYLESPINILTGDDNDIIFKINENCNNIKGKTILPSTVSLLHIGMTGSQYLNSINNNLQNLENGFKVQVNKPQLILRFDDGDESIYTGWFPLLTSLGVVGNAFVWCDNIGDDTFMTLENLLEIQTAGWEVSSHGKNNAPYTDFTEAELDTWLKESRDELLAMDLNCKFYGAHGVANGHDSRTYYIAKRYFLFNESCNPATATANPIAIDIKNVTILAADYTTGMPELDITTTEGIAALKSLLDEIVGTNRLLVMAIHKYYSTYRDGYIEFVNHAKSLDIDIVTSQQAYDSLIPL